MAFNNGVFSRLYNWVNDKNANIDITASRFDGEDDGFATGLSTCMLKDGTQTLTANIPFGGFKITGYGSSQVPSARTDAPSLGQVQDGVIYFVAAGGTSDAITAGYSPVLTVLVDGQLCYARATAANTTATPTFSPNGLTARTITKWGGQALLVGDIPGANAIIELRYDLANTRWELLNPRSISGTVIQISEGVVVAVESGSTTIPLDDTIPQKTEGDQYMSLSFTPKSTTSTLYIEVLALLSSNTAGVMIGALFQDSGANSISASLAQIPIAGNAIVLSLAHKMTSGTTSAISFTFRAGLNSANATTMNGIGGSRFLGGVAESSIKITEVAA